MNSIVSNSAVVSRAIEHHVPITATPSSRGGDAFSLSKSSQSHSPDSAVVISLSEEAKSALSSESSDRHNQRKSDPSDLSEEEQAQVQELKKRDQEVRRHEQAHANVGGQYAGSPNYEFKTGPDGQSYAVGGHVSIDVAPVNGDPEATIQKMDVVKRAALAPAEPSPADRSVAAQADATKLQAMAELTKKRSEESTNGDTDSSGPNTGSTMAESAKNMVAHARGKPPGDLYNVVA